MQKPLVFMMGRSPAFLPTDRQYARNHMWAMELAAGYRVGLSAYAVKLLGDLSHLAWSTEAGATITAGQGIGFIEGSKATSDLYAPMSGKVELVNHAVLADPTLINSNLYDAGWLLEIAGSSEDLLSPEKYLSHLAASWPLAQRILKGQAGGNHGR
jgi:glycine cleavage system H protein